MSMNTPLSDHINLQRLGGSELTLFMSFGLLNKLSAMVGDLNNLPDLYLVPELQDTIIYEILVPRDEAGKALQDYKLYQFSDELSTEEGSRLIEWCEAHLTSFFLKRLQAAQHLQQKLIQRMKG